MLTKTDKIKYITIVFLLINMVTYPLKINEIVSINGNFLPFKFLSK